MRMLYRVSFILASAVMMCGGAAQGAEVISVNLLQFFNDAQRIAPGSSYGVELAPFWTNVNGNGPTNLRDDSNTPTTLDLTITGGTRAAFGGNNINGTPMRAGQQFFGAAAPTFTFDEIPYDDYKVIVYLTGFNATTSLAEVTDGTTTYFWRPQPFGAALNQITDTDLSDGVDQGSYAIFGSDSAPLTGSSLTLTAQLTDPANGGGGIGGFQIVSVTAIPEPGMTPLAMLISGGLGLVRRRRA